MNEKLLSQLYLKETAFKDLMQQRIYDVLLIATSYDAFMMEEDGRVEEQIFMEYVDLNLSNPPRVTRVSNYAEAWNELANRSIDLIIAMPGVDISETFTEAKLIKARYNDVPFVVLTPFSREVSRRLQNEDFSGVDYVFSWLGNVDLLLAIIKLLEDKMNAPGDVGDVGVQMILLVEDSVRFYSSILPTLYKYLLRQSRTLATEALNAHEKMLRMRGRPKVMLARDYEEAVFIYEQYHDNMLGVISDVSFNRGGVKSQEAGLELAQYLRHRDEHLPIIIESSNSDFKHRVASFGGTFLDKNSKKLPVDLGRAITDNFGFGDFIIRDPNTGSEIMRLRNLKELQNSIFEIPEESLRYHAQRNDISRWLYSRALFPIAQVVAIHRMRNEGEAPAVRQLLFDLIVKYRRMKNMGVVAEFQKERFDKYSNFARIGQGSLGGKGRGIAFIDSIIKKNPICEDFDGVSIHIPHTVVLCTDIFDEFMEMNDLYPLALSDAPDDVILKAFLASPLPERLHDDLLAICDVIDSPLAIRSSSLLEDSHYQPFAGVYSTYMIPHVSDEQRMLNLLSNAIKAVYASVFYADSKAYMNATSNVIDQEKMAVIIQEMAGMQDGDFFYPTFSGVGRSINYYPLGDELATDGVVELAVGLGKYIVDGERALRFSPTKPKHVLQTSTPQLALRETQTEFLAINTVDIDENFTDNESFNITKKSIQSVADTGEMANVLSSYDFENDRLEPGNYGRGRKVVSFANVLQNDVYPLAKAVQFMLKTGAEQMGRPVEIEFAGTVSPTSPQKRKGDLMWLQIRPMVDRSEMPDEQIMSATDNVLIRSTKALGHGMMDGVRHIVFVKPEKFNFLNNLQIATEIEKINRTFTTREENYLLIGVGRWGSSDPALGVPVKWSHIAMAKVIVELQLPGRAIEPSQGTHFFQNLTSTGAAYFAVDNSEGNFFDSAYLDTLEVEYESEALRVVRLDAPLRIAINGTKSLGIVLKPENVIANL